MPAAGVPLSVPVPSPLSTNVTPLGSAAPPCARLGNGKPLVVTVKVLTAPIVNVVELALVIAGAFGDGQREGLGDGDRPRRWWR